MDKPTKPTDLMPRSFGGVKNNFSSSLQSSGYEDGVPAIYGGDNLNYQLDTTGKELNYCETICDFINEIPIGKTITVDNNNKLVYTNLAQNVPIATVETVGTVKPDGSSIGIQNDGTIYVTNTNYANKSLSNLNSTGESKLVPSQSGNSGKYLTTNGSSASWVSIPTYANQDLSNLSSTGNNKILPSQSGNSGKVLTTNGTNPYWMSAPFPVVNYSAGVDVTSSAYASSGTGYKPSSNGFLLIEGATGSGNASSNIVTYLYIYNTSGVTVLDQARIGGANVGTSDAVTLMVNPNYSYRVYPMRSGAYHIIFYPYY